MTVLKVLYKSKVRFDMNYYVSKHVPLVIAVMGPYGLKKTEIAKLTSTVDGSEPTYQVIFSAHFENEAGLKSGLQSPQIGEVMKDIPNYYGGGTPVLLIGEIVE
jgi:uncharacterized protein (TIGR02118 family)